MKERLLNFRLVFYPFLALFFGITMARKFYAGNLEVILLVLALFVGITILLLSKKLYKILLILLVFFFAGNGMYFIGSTTFNVKSWTQPVSVVGRISDDIENRGYSLSVVLDDVKINGESSHNIRLEIENYGEINVGDIVAFEGKLTKSKMFNLESFNSADYRAGVRYCASVDFDDLVAGEGFLKFDEKVRLAVKESLYKNMSEKNAGISFAVLFGDKSDVDEGTQNAYKTSGIIHVLTVSGLHVGFLTSLLYFVLKLCKANKYVRLIITTIFIIFYAYLCGFTPSVLRAGIMAVVLMLSKIFERRYDSLNSLGVAGFIICLFSPLSALDIGFQMSFFCVAGIIILAPTITKFLSKFIPNKIASLIALSISAQIGIIPFTANFFATLNILSVFANLLVVPIFSIIYPILFLIGFLSKFLNFMGIFLKIVDFVLVAVGGIANFFGSANLNFAISPFKTSIATIYFIMVMTVGKFILRKGLVKFFAFSVLTVILAVTFGFFLIPNKIQNQIVFLGDKNYSSVIVETKGQKVAIGQSSTLLRYLDKTQTKDLKYFVALDYLSDYYFDAISEHGVKIFIGDQNNDKNKNFEIFEENKSYIVGKFGIEYIKKENTQGVLVSFGDNKIFVASSEEKDYNILENMNLNFVFSSTGEEKTANFIDVTSECGGDYCLEEVGNMKFIFNGKDWSKRGID